MMRVITALLIFLPVLAIARPSYGSLQVSGLHKVIDGDTIRVSIDSVHPLLGNQIKIRVRDIDTPEISKGRYGYKCQQELELGLEAKEVAEGFLMGAERVELRNVSRGKYFRIAADVYVGEQSLADVLMQRDLAHPYIKGKGKKKSWCE